uniref:Neur_chan_LBD domain-containing protein n=2 Tax=Steinernema glaseri TaxID=37863 RepID=A0A1I7YID7_9BILA
MGAQELYRLQYVLRDCREKVRGVELYLSPWALTLIRHVLSTQGHTYATCWCEPTGCVLVNEDLTDNVVPHCPSPSKSLPLNVIKVVHIVLKNLLCGAEYLVRFLGYRDNRNSWIPEHDHDPVFLMTGMRALTVIEDVTLDSDVGMSDFLEDWRFECAKESHLKTRSCRNPHTLDVRISRSMQGFSFCFVTYALFTLAAIPYAILGHIYPPRHLL